MSDAIALELTRYSKVRPRRKSRNILMRLSSANELTRKEMSGTLMLERPSMDKMSRTSLGERLNCRPPLRADLEGPTPCSYSAQLPAPAIHCSRINPKAKYIRDALPNPSTDVWTHNISLTLKTPGPLSYLSHNVMGLRCPVVRQAPAFSLTPRRLVYAGSGGVTAPSPDSYDSAKAMEQTLTHHPVFSIATRKNFSTMPSTPGPAHYHPLHTITQHQGPAFSMQRRRENRMRTF